MPRKICFNKPDDTLVCSKNFNLFRVSSGDSAVCSYSQPQVPDVLFNKAELLELDFKDVRNQINSNDACFGSSSNVIYKSNEDLHTGIEDDYE